MIKVLALCAVAALAIGDAAPACAAGTTNRVWVSGRGADAAGCGAPTSPCRSFQYVVSNVIAPGGEIDVLDPAGYGAVTITHALSIVNDGVGTAGVQATSGNAITITAGAGDGVTLRGLNIDGLGLAANGIVFNSGASLTVVNCVIRHFAHGVARTTGDGILIQPTSGSVNFLVSNVIAADNGYAGVYFVPPSGTPDANGVMDHVTAADEQFGIAVDTTSSAGGTVTAAITNSVASLNSGDGVFLSGADVYLSVAIDNSTISSNSVGMDVEGAPIVLIGRSLITSNFNDGIYDNTAPNSVHSYGDNRINSNAEESTQEDIGGDGVLVAVGLR